MGDATGRTLHEPRKDSDRQGGYEKTNNCCVNKTTGCCGEDRIDHSTLPANLRVAYEIPACRAHARDEQFADCPYSESLPRPPQKHETVRDYRSEEREGQPGNDAWRSKD